MPGISSSRLPARDGRAGWLAGWHICERRLALPSFPLPARLPATWCLLVQSARDYRYALPPIRGRPASATEGVAYLADPVFSSCTVPIVWYPMWLSNIAHTFRGAQHMWQQHCPPACLGWGVAGFTAQGLVHMWSCCMHCWRGNGPPASLPACLMRRFCACPCCCCLCHCRRRCCWCCRQRGQDVWCAAGHALG